MGNVLSKQRAFRILVCVSNVCINCGWAGQRNGGSDQSTGPQTRRGQVVLAQLPVHSDTIHWQLVLLLQPDKPVTYNLLSVNGQ